MVDHRPAQRQSEQGESDLLEGAAFATRMDGDLGTSMNWGLIFDAPLFTRRWRSRNHYRCEYIGLEN